MTRAQLEHILRAAAGITGADEFVIVGSQAVLGSYPNAPRPLTNSMEADLFTFRSPEDSNLIDGSIGEDSPFHQTFGYCAHGIGEETSTLPRGWKDRLVPVKSENTGGATGLCLEVHDLAVAKLAAGREKDLEYVSALFKHGLVDERVVRDRLGQTDLPAEQLQLCLQRLDRLSGA